jgi:hypothetical protein
MKKMLLVVALLCASTLGVKAQSVADDITQLLLDMQKLSQLKQILSDMYTGYTVVYQGYENIKSISQGTFSLHKTFLDGLLAVSSAVSGYSKVADIINKEAQLVEEYQRSNKYLQGSGQFTSAELGYFLTVYNNLIQNSLKNVSELLMVVTAGELRMSDGERLATVDRIDGNISGQLSFLKRFDNLAAVQAAQRQQSVNDQSILKALYGLGP